MPAPRRRTRQPSVPQLRNIDYTDREMLFVLDEVVASDGTILAEDVCREMGLDPDTPKGKRAVSTRLAWMKRYGMVDKIDPRAYGGRRSDPPKYIITPFGRMLMNGKLSAAVQRAIDSEDVGADILLVRKLITKAYLEVGGQTSIAVRREYLHTEAKRPR